MRKRILVTLSATSTIFSMLLSPCITSYADELQTETTTVTSGEVGSITITNGDSAVSASGATVTVQGDVTTSGSNPNLGYTDHSGAAHPQASPAIDAQNGSNVTVNGNISAGGGGVEQTAINANNSTVTVNDGNVSGTNCGVLSNGSTVTVDGNVTGASAGVEADGNGSTIIIDGNVTSYGKQSNYTNEQEEIIGTSTFSTGVISMGDNNITVTGDVYSPQKGLEIHTTNPDTTNNGQIIVEGTITGNTGIHVTYTATETNGKTPFNSTDQVSAATPEITVFQIDSANPVIVTVTGVDDYEATEQIVNAINYIIQMGSDVTLSNENPNVTKVGNLDTVNIDEAFTVAATVPEGYFLSGGNNVSVTDNQDGTFTLTLKDPRGGIYVSVRLIPVNNDNNSTSYVEEPSYSDPEQAPAETIIVTTNSSDADASDLVASISGSKPAQTINFNISNITPQQYKASIISNVATVPANGAFNIITDTIATLDKGMIEAFATRPDIDINIVFPYDGKMMKVTIPAGYDLNTLLDEFGYCGFLRLMSLLGAVEL